MVVSEINQYIEEKENFKEKNVANQEDHKVFSLDHFEVSGETSNLHKRTSNFGRGIINQDSQSNSFFRQ
jgi:hypothetical protein